MDANQFNHLLAQGHTHIPVAREVLTDVDTPLSAYLKLSNQPFSYLFESVHGGERWGRYSIIGLACSETIEVRGQQVTHRLGGQILAQDNCDDPLEWIEQFGQQFKVPDIEGLPRFCGGLVGYFGYDTVRYVEPRLGACAKTDPLDTPDILLMVSKEVLVFDNLRGSAFIIVLASAEEGFEQANRRLEELSHSLQKALEIEPLPVINEPEHSDEFVSGFSEEGFIDAVNTAKDYVTAGDVMQVVLSQRLSAAFDGEPINVYRHLRRMNPSPYMYYVDMGDFHIVGSSPEILVRTEDEQVVVRPIAGTRHRGNDEAEDLALEKELLADPKELAEHLMLIDLGRNDVGRVAQTGTVEVTDKMIVERYSHVMHIVSNVVGTLRDEVSTLDVLRATFPAGTVSGAPKIRAMEIIDELEPVKRGVYSGAVGYLAWDGEMDTAIAIRTAVIKDQQIHIQAGAGIVYDSIAQNEWTETMNKAKAVLRAASMAQASNTSKKRSEA